MEDIDSRISLLQLGVLEEKRNCDFIVCSKCPLFGKVTAECIARRRLNLRPPTKAEGGFDDYGFLQIAKAKIYHESRLVKKEKEVEKKEVDWSKIDKKWKYMATNASGTTRLYEYKPIADGRCGNYWRTDGTSEVYQEAVPNWRETLIERPKEEEYVVHFDVTTKLTIDQLKEVQRLIKKMEAENK